MEMFGGPYDAQEMDLDEAAEQVVFPLDDRETHFHQYKKEGKKFVYKGIKTKKQLGVKWP